MNVGLVETFIHEHFLQWIESLSGLQSLIDAVPSLVTLERWLSSHHKQVGYPYFLYLTYAQAHDQSSNLKLLVKDAMLFYRYFVDAITVSAPHVYISALAFAPKSSMIGQLYAPRFKNIIQVVAGQSDEWPTRQAVIHGHSGRVKFVAFSADGGRVVSCSDDNTILISDVDTSEIAAGQFEEHSGGVLCAVYSTDGKTVLSVSRDKTIRRWDAECGIVDGPVKHDTVTIDMIYECEHVMFSHNRKYIALVQSKYTYTTGDRQWDTSVISVHDVVTDRKSTRLNSSHSGESRMPSSA